MNPQIRKLAEQAGFEITPWRDELLPCVHQEGPIDIELEKFAQLIVQRCINTVALYGVVNWDNPDISWVTQEVVKELQEKFES
jgi:hypothetical protein